MREDPESRDLLVGCVSEAAAVGRAAGVGLPDDVIQQVVTMIDSAPAAATASMQRDIMEGKPSELSAQNGAVVRLGRSFEIETPINAFICAALSPLERRARGELTFE